jgi:hypothetical protein
MAKFVLITVRGVLLLSEAGLDECEACLHEDDEDRSDDHPQQVGRFGQRLDGRTDLVIGFVGKCSAGDHQCRQRRADRASQHVFEYGSSTQEFSSELRKGAGRWHGAGPTGAR